MSDVCKQGHVDPPRRPDGFCKECHKAYALAWRAANKAHVHAYGKVYKATNAAQCRAATNRRNALHPEKARARVAAWNAANPGKNTDRSKQWRKAHPAAHNANNAKRRATKFQATPAWVDHDAIRDIYFEAAYQQMHVDHIVPLQSESVCGLHAEHNLQLLSVEDNSAKGNRTWPGM